MSLEWERVGIGVSNDMVSFSVDTGCKLNVYKTFRRRPGLLLNVLCMFNLRPVSTGFIAFHSIWLKLKGMNLECMLLARHVRF